jgi:hypothetical protein
LFPVILKDKTHASIRLTDLPPSIIRAYLDWFINSTAEYSSLFYFGEDLLREATMFVDSVIVKVVTASSRQDARDPTGRYVGSSGRFVGFLAVLNKAATRRIGTSGQNENDFKLGLLMLRFIAMFSILDSNEVNIK